MPKVNIIAGTEIGIHKAFKIYKYERMFETIDCLEKLPPSGDRYELLKLGVQLPNISPGELWEIIQSTHGLNNILYLFTILKETEYPLVINGFQKKEIPNKIFIYLPETGVTMAIQEGIVKRIIELVADLDITVVIATMSADIVHTHYKILKKVNEDGELH